MITITNKLDEMIPNPICELNYNNGYELLIATMLSAQSTDKRVNLVTSRLFLHTIEEISDMELADIENIIKSVGTFRRKAIYVKDISKSLLLEYDGILPNNRDYLESLPGVGRKTVNVVLANIYDVPTLAVDTHVQRVTNILGIVKNENDVLKIEKKLAKLIPKEKWNRVNDQLVLFGRYICKAKRPECFKCAFSDECKKKQV